MPRSGITRDEIIKWGGPEVFNQALSLVNSGDVAEVRYDDETVTISGKIERPDGWAMPVSLKLKEQGRIESHCPCYDNQRLGLVCPHVVALGIALSVLEDDAPESDMDGGRALSDPNPTLSDPNPTLNDPKSPWTHGTATSTSRRARSSRSASSTSRTHPTRSSARRAPWRPSARR